MKRINTKKIVLSVIVPVYNVDKYLKECIESIIAQTFEDWEIILVDDGSDDKSVQICEHYSKTDSRVKLVRQEHSGASAARITGIENSRGEYICFVDSDDWMEGMAFEKMLMPLLQDCELDICMCSYVKHEGSKKTVMCGLVSCMPQIYSASKALEKMFVEEEYTWSLWGKIYKRELFFKEDLLHEPWPHTYGDDTYVNWRIFKKALTVACLPLNLYHYRLNPESIMHQKIDSRRLVYFDIYDEILNEIDNLHSHLAQCIIGILIDIGLDILRELSLEEYRSNGWYQACAVLNKYLVLYENELTEQQKQMVDIINKSDKELKKLKEECWLELKRFYDRHKNIFIYGAGKLAGEVAEKIMGVGLDFSGFIVTELEGNLLEKDAHKVFSLQDVIDEYSNSNIGIVTGLSKKNLQQVIPLFEKMDAWEIFDGTRLSLRSL